MDKKTKQKIFSKREVVKYSATRAYFGKLTGANLASAYGQFKHSQDWDKPITSAKVLVGQIDGGVICRALWHEMSYNPARFGKVSPFLHNGVENIYHFCRNGVPEGFPGFEIIEKIRHKMIDFMMLNGRKKGMWYDVIDTQNGMVTINLIDGHSDDNYKVLTTLREMIRFITNQNLQDFNRKSYRVQMLNVIAKRHPNGMRDNKPIEYNQKINYTPVSMMQPETDEDRMDKAAEAAQITADNCKYVPADQYEQAKSDLARFYDNQTKTR